MASAAKCRHGHQNGVIIHLAEESEEPWAYLGRLRQRAADGDEMRHHYVETLRAVPGHLTMMIQVTFGLLAPRRTGTFGAPGRLPSGIVSLEAPLLRQRLSPADHDRESTYGDQDR